MLPPDVLVSPGHIVVPSDISSAAFWMVLAAIRQNTKITIRDVGLNPTRVGIVDVMKAMKARITIENIRQSEGEPVGDITVSTSLDTLRAIDINDREFEMATLIDEVPIISVLAAVAKGETTILDASELRVKESDRIKTTVTMLRAFGVPVEELPDGLRITGRAKLHPGEVESHGDHRIAMAGSIMALAIGGRSSIIDVDCVATSYPGFSQGLLKISQEVSFS
jgi:3-phosphoshikimate 1-carboxyvinyltransferase